MIRTIVGILALLAAGCTFNIAPNATDGSLLTVRGGDVRTTVPVGTNGSPAVAGVGAEPKSTTEWIVYVLFTVAVAIYPMVIRPIRQWIAKRTVLPVPGGS